MLVATNQAKLVPTNMLQVSKHSLRLAKLVSTHFTKLVRTNI